MVGSREGFSSHRVYHEVMLWSVAVMWMFALCAYRQKVSGVRRWFVASTNVPFSP